MNIHMDTNTVQVLSLLITSLTTVLVAWIKLRDRSKGSSGRRSTHGPSS